MKIDQIPVEMLEMIFDRLLIAELDKCREVCMRLFKSGNTPSDELRLLSSFPGLSAGRPDLLL